MELRSGTLLQENKYRIERTLGYGGFAITYLAEQVLASRMVCIKEFFPKSFYNRDDDKLHISLGSQGSAEMMDAYKRKFLTEARTIAHLDHPNIIHILDIFEENDTVYYVMDYINGGTLLDIVRISGPMDEKIGVELIMKIAEALTYIHARNIAHLDIKPSNVMVRKAGNRPILIDFGLSKQYDLDGHQLSSTPVGISHGFAPIEQYQMGGVKEFSPKPDVYSLGATLYFILSGMVPPQAADLLNTGLPDIKGVSSATMAVIRKAMSVSTKGRYDSADEMIEALKECLVVCCKPTVAANGGGNGECRQGNFANDDMGVSPTLPAVEKSPEVTQIDVRDTADTSIDLEALQGGALASEPATPATPSTPYNPTPTTNSREQSTKNRKSWPWVVLVLVLLCGIGVATYFYLSGMESEPTTDELADDPSAINRLDDEEWTYNPDEVGPMLESSFLPTEVVVDEELNEVTDDEEELDVVADEEEELDPEEGAVIEGLFNDLANGLAPAPVLTLTSSSSVSVAGSLTHGSISYTLENPIEGVSVSVTGKPDWIYISHADGAINYSVYANNASRSRSATLTVSYGEQSFTVSFTQGPGDSSPNVIPDTPSRSSYSTSGGSSTERNSY